MKKRFFLFVGAVVSIAITQLQAAVPLVTSYQGRVKVSGANFSGAVQTPCAPPLNVPRSNNAAIVSWPVPSIGFVLQENPVLGTANWTNVGTLPTTNGPNLQVVVPSPPGNRFYRLRQA